MKNNSIINDIVDEFKKFPQVRAVSLGGSGALNSQDKKSDIDIEVFVEEEIPVENRIEIIKKYSSKYEAGCEYFGSGDEFWVDKINLITDILYADVNWIESIIKNVWELHKPSNGYTTCFLYTIKYCRLLYDKDNWLGGLKKRLDTPYPDELKTNIIKRNLMLLFDKPFFSYYEQIEKALARKDIVSVNHRLAAFLASYFDIIFANNKLLHSGEKRLVNYALKHCEILPEKFSDNIGKVLTQPNPDTLNILNDMILKLKNVLNQQPERINPCKSSLR